MKCKYCGAEVENQDNLFCTNCGKRLYDGELGQKKGSKKALKIIAGIVVVAAIVGGGIFGYHTYDVHKQITAFKKDVSTYKGISKNYQLGSKQLDYDDLYEQCNECIEDKKVDQIKSLKQKMTAMKSDVVELNQEVKKYKEELEEKKNGIGEYMLDTDKQSEYDDIVSDYQLGVEDYDLDICKDSKEKLNALLSEVETANTQTYNEVRQQVEATDLTVLSDEDKTFVETNKATADSQLAEKKFKTACETINSVKTKIDEATLAAAAASSADTLKDTEWELSGGEAAGIKVTKEQLKKQVGKMTLKFKADGIASMSAKDQKGDCNYKLDGNKLTLEESGSSFEGTVEGDKITLEMSGVKLFFKKK
ncbi:hypothetical protein lbkm_1741 [Lachnospiraceae bacterium KM106-2]|nr:hypothetical protein lbkm_1741 [Lachnospiraceae bacterium KM106-2]